MVLIDNLYRGGSVFYMNNVTPEQKNKVLKTLSLIALILITVLIAWLSVQIVKIFPSAINSLASLADSVYNYNPREVRDLTIEPIPESINTGAELPIAWSMSIKTGSYAFSYECQEGISLDLKTSETEFKGIECEKSYDLGLSDEATLVIYSEKEPETNITYSIAYYKKNSSESSTRESQTIAIKNPDLVANIPKEEEVAPVEIPQSTSTRPIVENTPTYEYTYAIPVSDPKGFTDLNVSYVGIGEIDGQGKFISTGIIKSDVSGAVQFAVHNIGTKTSGDWTFSAKLPGGINYESEKQIPLKPNERAILTLSFPAITDTKLQSITLSSETESDKNKNNDSATRSVVVVK